MMLAARIALTAVSVAQTHSELYPGLATLAASEPELHGNDGFFLEAADSADSDGDGATVCTMLRAHLRLFPWQAHVWARLGVCQVKADVPLVATRRSEAHPLRMSRQAAEACADLDGEPLPLTRQAAFDLYTSAAEEQGPAPARASCATTPVERRALERLRESEAALELAEWLGGAASATAAREAVLSLLAPPRLCATDAQALADGGTALVRAAIAALADPDRLTAPGGPFRKLCTVPNLVVRVEGSGPSATSLRLALAGLRVCGVVTLVSDPPMSGAALERLQASVDAEFAVVSGSCRVPWRRGRVPGRFGRFGYGPARTSRPRPPRAQAAGAAAVRARRSDRRRPLGAPTGCRLDAEAPARGARHLFGGARVARLGRPGVAHGR